MPNKSLERHGVEADNDAQLSEYFVRRHRLLNPPWERKLLSLREIRRAGHDLAGDPDDLRLFGMSPRVWYVLGLRILGRTAVEVTRDQHAQFLAKSVANTLVSHGYNIADVIDPFVGSGNLMYHFLREFHATRGIGFDINADLLALTERNFSRLRLLGKLRHSRLTFLRQDWSHSPSYLENVATLVIVAPPWGAAFDTAGLDLRKTTPPVAKVLQALRRSTGSAPTFAIVQIHPMMVKVSVDAIKSDYTAFTTVKSDNPAIASRVDYILLRL